LGTWSVKEDDRITTESEEESDRKEKSITEKTSTNQEKRNAIFDLRNSFHKSWEENYPIWFAVTTGIIISIFFLIHIVKNVFDENTKGTPANMNLLP
jgi:uncharacterized integral membrane protein